MYYSLDVDFSGGTPALTHSVHCGKTSHCLRTDFPPWPYAKEGIFKFSLEVNYPVTPVKGDNPEKHSAFSQFI
jgi:hypothetical protein